MATEGTRLGKRKRSEQREGLRNGMHPLIAKQYLYQPTAGIESVKVAVRKIFLISSDLL